MGLRCVCLPLVLARANASHAHASASGLLFASAEALILGFLAFRDSLLSAVWEISQGITCPPRARSGPT